ncbi:hypothetical protein AOL_s00088g11 [Orbilia oligospora ATCC 24927]|uniref:Uncharacterized protein n=1 Tax=Arthrobotrys oligospora (strain ATCC 24927 / CBS 115.81 / DSM 1491) TaxID=756982 RepID=G1XHP8_ARTOA|nr:hypothetical protein AOL_s00088g11 [Orbilia oligospora ATCC 24927]EGX47296.1 hypothetical protein AOL_s00088g11 [Orbilia oligospora ATCC 24927]
MSHTGIPFPQRIADRAGNKRLDSQTQGYRGKCRISTRYLRFNNGRVFSEAKVREWRNIFSLGGCDRYSKDLVLAAIVSHDQLSELDFDGNMIQQASSNIECLYGREMITAAQDYLPLRDDWCTLGPNETVQEFLKAEFLERSVRKDEFTDGEIFRKIRLYAQEGNFESSRKWWSRLSPTKANNLKQLLKNNSLSSKFDSLLKFPGLWPDIQLGMFHTLHGAKCPEVWPFQYQAGYGISVD